MSNIELSTVYNPKEFEERIYQTLLNEGYYKPNKNAKKDKTFTIVMPPPNVTGILHMGHALNNSLQDIFIRYKRLCGYNTLWIPGTDHAGIATQHVVEKELEKEGKSRKEMTREDFVNRTWKTKHRHHKIITEQLKKIACSCDWDHERFTMDEGLSDAVKECFVELYKRGLIYKSKYLVNYCTHCGTALSDDEVEHKTENSFLWDIKYPFADGTGYVVVSTTRPETLFGDTAVAVHPNDERYKEVIDKEIKLPLTNRVIHFVKDSMVDMEYGTGAVKVTPAHSPDDYQCALRHNLEMISVIKEDGTMDAITGAEFSGLDVKTARKAVVEKLSSLGLLLKEKPITHEVGHCYRCSTPVEPFLSNQWFVKMDIMAEKALKSLDDKEIVFYPKKWESTYRHWMKNIRPWCISRQLWWGHRIPSYTCENCGNIVVSKDTPKECPKCKTNKFTQDEDVLDTWFSSWLWPFSTLGWPKKTKDFETYFPTSTLITAYDIIFFWVARMIMASLEFTGKVPFKDIYITSLVRDIQGRKMSKSLGNGIDPIEVVNQYGSDAMKFTLAFMASQGQDIKIDMNSFKLGSKFCNKIWNASRFILMNIGDHKILNIDDCEKDVWDNYILYRLNETIKSVREAFDAYKVNDATSCVYDFFWNDFCAFYIERTKLDITDKTISVLLYVLYNSLLLINPIIPLVTEEIYSHFPNKEGYLINKDYPEYDESLECESVKNDVKEVKALIEIINGMRSLKHTLGINDNQTVDSYVSTTSNFIKGEVDTLKKFAHLTSVTFTESSKVQGAIYTGGYMWECSIIPPSNIDLKSRITKTEKDIEKEKKIIQITENNLNNPYFIKRASQEVIEKEKNKNEASKETLKKLSEEFNILKEALK